MRNLTEIIVHCSATKPHWMDNKPTSDKVAEIRRWHTDPKPDGRGWSDIGYHWIIDRDGTVLSGRSMFRDGAHVKGRNKGTVGICLLGGFGSSENDGPHDNYTPSQLAALRMLIADLQGEYPSITKVSGHNEYAAKACPGFRVQQWLKDVEPRTKVTQATTIKATAATAVAGAGGVATVLGSLSPTGQIIVLVCAAIAGFGLAWIARERIRKWAAGDR